MTKKEKIICLYGLGNEGKEYLNSRHNIGKEIIDFYLSPKNFLRYAYYSYYDHLILASNLGFMNESGQGAKELLTHFKLKPSNLLVIHDDADLLFPFFKFSFGVGSAGHKGVESIIKALKTNKFWRLRIGIQKKKRVKAEKIVLEKWTKDEKVYVEKIKDKFKIILEKLKERLPNELNLAKNYFLIDEK